MHVISRLVSLVPQPRVNLTRFHGVFAPNSKYRAKVTPAGRGKRKKCHSVDEADQISAEKRASMRFGSIPANESSATVASFEITDDVAEVHISANSGN